MTTAVECLFVTPMGEPIVNSPVDFQPAKSGFMEELDGIIMPRPASATTDAEGKCTVHLWPSPVPYYVTCMDTDSDAEVFYKITVPVVADGVTLRLQDLTIADNSPVSLPGMQFELVGNAQLRIKVIGSDGVSRHATLNLA